MEIMEVMSQKTRDGSFKQKGVMMSNAVESSGKIDFLLQVSIGFIATISMA